MRISAKEAWERAQIKCSAESILDAIYRNISEESRYGNYFIEKYFFLSFLILHILVRISFVSTALRNNRLIDNTFDHLD